jgi:y4mF family transcriptional regulator
MTTSEFVKEKRNATGLTQPELAAKAGVGLRFVRDLEQGKETLRIDKVNQVLKLFGYELGPIQLLRGEISEMADAQNRSDADVTRKRKNS